MRPFGERTPALLTRTSRRPKRSTARATTASTCGGIGDVRRQGLGRVGPLAHAVDRLRQRLRRDVAQDQRGAGLAAQPSRQRAAERAAGSGDGHDPARGAHRRHTSRYPPSTVRTAPVTNAAASDARNW